MNDYQKFIEGKTANIEYHGFEINPDKIHPQLYDFQKDIVMWNLRKGKSAEFTMTGTGKTLMQCEWARQIHAKENKPLLIIAPLAVSYQTVNEAKKIDLNVNKCRDQDDIINGINIINYEMIHHFDMNQFVGIVLDESSILKSYSGKIRNQIITQFNNTPYKLACTATPAPNDFMELGNHSEFLNELRRVEMLAMYFVHDCKDTAKWRLKKHAQGLFWNWLSDWCVLLTKPSDLGYQDNGFNLPPLQIKEHIIKTQTKMDGFLFPMPAQTLMERKNARRQTTEERVKYCADIVNSTDECFLIWCDLNCESGMLSKYINNSIEIRGAHSSKYKEEMLLNFGKGNIKVLITKPSIAGFGMNWQHCHNMAFVGLSDSFEKYFQAVRRCWRFGQKKPVNAHIIISELEGNVLNNIKRKEKEANIMINEMMKYTKVIMNKHIHNVSKTNKQEFKNNYEEPLWK